MRPLLLIAALLVSSVASAQAQFTFPTTTSATDTYTFGKSSCSDTVSVTWTRTSSLAPCSSLLIWATSASSCGDAPVSGDYSVTEISQTNFGASLTGTFNVDLSMLPYGASTDGGTGGCAGLADEETFRLCGSTTSRDSYTSVCSSTIYRLSALKFTFDGQPPDAPTISSASGLDQAISVAVSAPDDATEVSMTVMLDGEQVTSVRQAVGKGSLVAGGLVNNTTYQVQAYAYDAAGNQSDPSATADVTPIKTDGFLELYENAGGTTGCGAAGGSLAGGAMLTAVGLWLFSRRNRSWFEQ